MTAADKNREIYNDPDVVGHYAHAAGLQSSEAYAFEKYVTPGAAVLDLGMGGGRTTPYLAARASRYIGADYSSAMVDVCRAKFPKMEFHCADASDLSQFADEAFDAVIFSFNGIDYIRTDDARTRCLLEVRRVLKPNGHFIFSSHNAKGLGIWPVFAGAGPLKIIWRTVRASVRTVSQFFTMIGTSAYSAGVGYIVDPIHGGLATLVSTPESFQREATAAGFELIETINGLYPSRVPRAFTPWYYYVLRKPASGAR